MTGWKSRRHIVVGRDYADVVRSAANVEVLSDLLFVKEIVAAAHRLLGAENREGLPFAVAGYLRYKCSPVWVKWAHDMVARFRNYCAYLIFQRGDLVGGSVFEMNCD